MEHNFKPLQQLVVVDEVLKETPRNELVLSPVLLICNKTLEMMRRSYFPDEYERE